MRGTGTHRRVLLYVKTRSSRVQCLSTRQQGTGEPQGVWRHADHHTEIQDRKSIIMSQKHLKKGEANPPVNKDLLRIYSMRFCPFAERPLLVLAAKGIEHEVVNCNLMEKPEFLLERNPAGKVPVMEYKGKVIPESLVICDLLDELFPDKPLWSKDPYQKAMNRLAMEKFSSSIGSFYKAIRNPDDKELMNALVKSLKDFQDLLMARKTPFLGGDQCGMADLMIYPFLERMMTVPQLMSNVPDLTNYTNRLTALPYVQSTIVTAEELKNFYAGYIAGNPVYD
ncbi:glutathione S-transferase omega-1-like [Diadema setosum]|uniref:glutathione S-transferase omega-1-like n=1 Tax=Diadema setosum TaxID=31175 RepID=UPI003B3B0F5E